MALRSKEKMCAREIVSAEKRSGEFKKKRRMAWKGNERRQFRKRPYGFLGEDTIILFSQNSPPHLPTRTRPGLVESGNHRTYMSPFCDTKFKLPIRLRAKRMCLCGVCSERAIPLSVGSGSSKRERHGRQGRNCGKQKGRETTGKKLKFSSRSPCRLLRPIETKVRSKTLFIEKSPHKMDNRAKSGKTLKTKQLSKRNKISKTKIPRYCPYPSMHGGKDGRNDAQVQSEYKRRGFKSSEHGGQLYLSGEDSDYFDTCTQSKSNSITRNFHKECDRSCNLTMTDGVLKHIQKRTHDRKRKLARRTPSHEIHYRKVLQHRYQSPQCTGPNATLDSVQKRCYSETSCKHNLLLQGESEGDCSNLISLARITTEMDKNCTVISSDDTRSILSFLSLSKLRRSGVNDKLISVDMTRLVPTPRKEKLYIPESQPSGLVNQTVFFKRKRQSHSKALPPSQDLIQDTTKSVMSNKYSGKGNQAVFSGQQNNGMRRLEINPLTKIIGPPSTGMFKEIELSHKHSCTGIKEGQVSRHCATSSRKWRPSERKVRIKIKRSTTDVCGFVTQKTETEKRHCHGKGLKSRHLSLQRSPRILTSKFSKRKGIDEKSVKGVRSEVSEKRNIKHSDNSQTSDKRKNDDALRYKLKLSNFFWVSPTIPPTGNWFGIRPHDITHSSWSNSYLSIAARSPSSDNEGEQILRVGSHSNLQIDAPNVSDVTSNELIGETLSEEHDPNKSPEKSLLSHVDKRSNRRVEKESFTGNESEHKEEANIIISDLRDKNSDYCTTTGDRSMKKQETKRKMQCGPDAKPSFTSRHLGKGPSISAKPWHGTNVIRKHFQKGFQSKSNDDAKKTHEVINNRSKDGGAFGTPNPSAEAESKKTCLVKTVERKRATTSSMDRTKKQNISNLFLQRRQQHSACKKIVEEFDKSSCQTSGGKMKLQGDRRRNSLVFEKASNSSKQTKDKPVHLLKHLKNKTCGEEAKTGSRSKAGRRNGNEENYESREERLRSIVNKLSSKQRRNIKSNPVPKCSDDKNVASMMPQSKAWGNKKELHIKTKSSSNDIEDSIKKLKTGLETLIKRVNSGRKSVEPDLAKDDDSFRGITEKEEDRYHLSDKLGEKRDVQDNKQSHERPARRYVQLFDDAELFTTNYRYENNIEDNQSSVSLAKQEAGSESLLVNVDSFNYLFTKQNETVSKLAAEATRAKVIFGGDVGVSRSPEVTNTTLNELQSKRSKKPCFGAPHRYDVAVSIDGENETQSTIPVHAAIHNEDQVPGHSVLINEDQVYESVPVHDVVHDEDQLCEFTFLPGISNNMEEPAEAHITTSEIETETQDRKERFSFALNRFKRFMPKSLKPKSFRARMGHPDEDYKVLINNKNDVRPKYAPNVFENCEANEKYKSQKASPANRSVARMIFKGVGRHGKSPKKAYTLRVNTPYRRKTAHTLRVKTHYRRKTSPFQPHVKKRQKSSSAQLKEVLERPEALKNKFDSQDSKSASLSRNLSFQDQNKVSHCNSIQEYNPRHLEEADTCEPKDKITVTFNRDHRTISTLEGPDLMVPSLLSKLWREENVIFQNTPQIVHGNIACEVDVGIAGNIKIRRCVMNLNLFTRAITQSTPFICREISLDPKDFRPQDRKEKILDRHLHCSDTVGANEGESWLLKVIKGGNRQSRSLSAHTNLPKPDSNTTQRMSHDDLESLLQLQIDKLNENHGRSRDFFRFLKFRRENENHSGQTSSGGGQKLSDNSWRKRREVPWTSEESLSKRKTMNLCQNVAERERQIGKQFDVTRIARDHDDDKSARNNEILVVSKPVSCYNDVSYQSTQTLPSPNAGVNDVKSNLGSGGKALNAGTIITKPSTSQHDTLRFDDKKRTFSRPDHNKTRLYISSSGHEKRKACENQSENSTQDESFSVQSFHDITHTVKNDDEGDVSRLIATHDRYSPNRETRCLKRGPRLIDMSTEDDEMIKETGLGRQRIRSGTKYLKELDTTGSNLDAASLTSSDITLSWAKSSQSEDAIDMSETRVNENDNINNAMRMESLSSISTLDTPGDRNRLYGNGNIRNVSQFDSSQIVLRAKSRRIQFSHNKSQHVKASPLGFYQSHVADDVYHYILWDDGEDW